VLVLRFEQTITARDFFVSFAKLEIWPRCINPSMSLVNIKVNSLDAAGAPLGDERQKL
jgi:hypothetical protein